MKSDARTLKLVKVDTTSDWCPYPMPWHCDRPDLGQRPAWHVRPHRCCPR